MYIHVYPVSSLNLQCKFTLSNLVEIWYTKLEQVAFSEDEKCILLYSYGFYYFVWRRVEKGAIRITMSLNASSSFELSKMLLLMAQGVKYQYCRNLSYLTPINENPSLFKSDVNYCYEVSMSPEFYGLT